MSVVLLGEYVLGDAGGGSVADCIKAAAAADVEQEINRAKEALRAQVATLVVAGAEKILGASIDVT